MILLVVGAGPLLVIIVAAAVGLWPDPNPNPAPAFNVGGTRNIDIMFVDTREEQWERERNR